MSRTKNNLDREFWNQMLRLHAVLAKAGNESVELMDILRNNQNGISDFVYGALGICGGAFAIAHVSLDQFLLLQRSKYLPIKEDMPTVDIPYMIFSSEEDRSLADFLFIGRRRHQVLTTNPPELYYHLPSSQEEHAESNSQPLLPWEKKLREQGFKFLYCPSGEVSFFLYAWRWLLRCAQMRGGTCPVDPNDEATDGLGASSFWATEFWRASQESPELEWIGAISEARRAVEAPPDASTSSQTTKFQSDALVAWDRIMSDVDNRRPDSKVEWQYLGLLDDKNLATQTLQALISYMRQLLALASKKQHVSQYQISEADKLIKTFASVSRKLPGLDRSGIPVCWEEIRETDLCRVIQQSIYFLLTEPNEEKKMPAFDLLRRLHRRARFPIIPYFYLTALDKRPKEHVVLPVWESYEFPVQIKDLGTHPAVILCLLTLRPMWDMYDDSTGPGLGAARKRRKDITVTSEAVARLYRSHSFFSVLARPIIEKGFYGNLVAPDIEADIRRAFGHEVKKVARIAGGNWVRQAEDLFEVDQQARSSSRSDKIGRLEIWHKSLADDLGIVPFRSISIAAARLINLWCLVNDPADIPFAKEIPTSIELFTQNCWKCALEGVCVHALSIENPSSVADIVEIKYIKEAILDIHRPIITTVSGTFPAIESGGGTDAVWLARILIALFTNCIQHGDPARPVAMHISDSEDSSFLIEVKNTVRREREKVLEDLIKAGIPHEKADLALERLDIAAEGIETMEGRAFNTKDVVELLLKKINGKIVEWPERGSVLPEEEYAVKVWIRYCGGTER